MTDNKVETALALMNSMILSGEDHSDTSIKIFEDARVELACLREQAVSVKPLEWVGWTGTGMHGLNFSLSENVYTEKLVVLMNGSFVGEFDNEVAAQAAAQADYEKRILSAIDARPVSEVRREAFEEAADLAISRAGEWEDEQGDAAIIISLAIRALSKGTTQ